MLSSATNKTHERPAILTGTEATQTGGVEKGKQLMVVPDPKGVDISRMGVAPPSIKDLAKRRVTARTREPNASAMERHFMRYVDKLEQSTTNVDPRDVAKLLSLANAEKIHGELGDYGKERPNEWMVAGANIGLAAMLALDIGMKVGSPLDALTAVATAVGAWIMSDLGSGFPFHWGVDVIGTPQTPWIGKMIAEFQKHHVSPKDITNGDFASVTYSTGQATAAILAMFAGALLFGLIDPSLMTETALVSFIVGGLNTQNFHRWAHMPKEETPKLIQWMQDHGMAITREEHLKHHHAPHEGNYCLVNGIWNKLLDDSKIARWAEKMVVKLSHGDVRPTTWIAGRNCDAIKAEAQGTTFRDVLKNIGTSISTSLPTLRRHA